MRPISTSRIHWQPSYRIVSSRFPPVGIFDAIAEPGDLEALFALEGMTNPRLREELGRIDLIPPARRIAGPGTTPIMSAFTHLNPEGSRFSNGRSGVYYASLMRDTAVAETAYHRARFLARTQEPSCTLEMRCYLADIVADLHDIRRGWPELHNPDSYAASQAAAMDLRTNGSDGIVYDSVRDAGSERVAVFYPDRISPAHQGPHLYYRWDGERIVRVVVVGEEIRIPQ